MVYLSTGQPAKASEQFKLALAQSPADHSLEEQIRAALAKGGTQ
jgi:hypothetical protein